jgi:hypothetical protein
VGFLVLLSSPNSPPSLTSISSLSISFSVS